MYKYFTKKEVTIIFMHCDLHLSNIEHIILIKKCLVICNFSPAFCYSCISQPLTHYWIVLKLDKVCKVSC